MLKQHCDSDIFRNAYYCNFGTIRWEDQYHSHACPINTTPQQLVIYKQLLYQHLWNSLITTFYLVS